MLVKVVINTCDLAFQLMTKISWASVEVCPPRNVAGYILKMVSLTMRLRSNLSCAHVR